MKSNRVLQIILLILIVVFVSVCGFLYAADSREDKRQTELTDSINKNQATLNSGLAQKAAKENEAVDLANQLAAANAALASVDFQDSAESIEYDRILFSIADTTNLQITSLAATSPSDIKENGTPYQITTFTVTVEGSTPGVIFTSTADSQTYINFTVANILDFVNTIATSSDFDTAAIQSVNIMSPEPMTDEELSNMNEDINAIVIEREGLQEEVDALAESIQAANQGILTQEEIDALIKTETAELVHETIATMSISEVQALFEEVGIDKTSAVITIRIWTYKGA